MRNGAYPFDWTLSSPQMIIDCLRDDFHTFLDPTQHVTVEPGISSNHLVYGSMVWGKNFDGIVNRNITFTHKDITIDKHYEYYKRCVERFRALLASPESKLFILTAQDMEYNQQEIYKLRDMLRQRIHIYCVYRYSMIMNRGIRLIRKMELSI